MEAKFAPSLANLYKGWWEDNFLFSPSNPFLSHIKWYVHYIDDLLLIWEGTHSDIESFVTCANKNPLNLEFSFDTHQSNINFLDLTLQGFYFYREYLYLYLP